MSSKVPQTLLDEWQAVQRAIADFRAVAHGEQMLCPHTHAVQFNPKQGRFAGLSEGYSRRCCIACGLTDTAEERWNPDSFDETSPLCGAEIVETFDQGYRFNHFTLPSITTYEPGHTDARYDALISGATVLGPDGTS